MAARMSFSVDGIRSQGFTIVELIVVMVIVAIIAAIAVPRYINQTTTAQTNSTNSLAAALSAASANNFAKRSANSSQGSAISNCTGISSLLSGGLPSGYSITSQAVSAGATVTCTLNGPSASSATFTGLGIS